jgi:hypothetical protein
MLKFKIKAIKKIMMFQISYYNTFQIQPDEAFDHRIINFSLKQFSGGYS